MKRPAVYLVGRLEKCISGVIAGPTGMGSPTKEKTACAFSSFTGARFVQAVFLCPGEKVKGFFMADYQAILDAIDAAVLAGVSGPGSLSAGGQSVEYRSLEDLMTTRKQYAAILAGSQSTTTAKINIARFKGGSPE